VCVWIETPNPEDMNEEQARSTLDSSVNSIMLNDSIDGDGRIAAESFVQHFADQPDFVLAIDTNDDDDDDDVDIVPEV
jgi:hypothetical protein